MSPLAPHSYDDDDEPDWDPLDLDEDEAEWYDEDPTPRWEEPADEPENTT